jgi:hypothetical protein
MSLRFSTSNSKHTTGHAWPGFHTNQAFRTANKACPIIVVLSAGRTVSLWCQHCVSNLPNADLLALRFRLLSMLFFSTGGDDELTMLQQESELTVEELLARYRSMQEESAEEGSGSGEETEASEGGYFFFRRSLTERNLMKSYC